jgi:hypothetical protein
MTPAPSGIDAAAIPTPIAKANADAQGRITAGRPTLRDRLQIEARV